METSATLSKLAEALCRAQSETRPIAKNGRNTQQN
jgi:hypothetical protein